MQQNGNICCFFYKSKIFINITIKIKVLFPIKMTFILKAKLVKIMERTLKILLCACICRHFFLICSGYIYFGNTDIKNRQYPKCIRFVKILSSKPGAVSKREVSLLIQWFGTGNVGGKTDYKNIWWLLNPKCLILNSNNRKIANWNKAQALKLW